MLCKKHIFIIIVLFCSLAIKAQECGFVLKGCVLDKDNSEHLGFAVVKLLNTGKTIQTNEYGEFAFEGLCDGNYRVQVQHLGCRDTVISVELTRTKKFYFKLPHSINNLSEVDIMDKRTEMKRTETVAQLQSEDIQKTKGQGLGDILKNITGITTLNTGATISKPMLHGMQGYRLLIMNNGVRQEGQQWGYEHAPEIDPFTAKKILVIKGAASLRYGSDAIAGVVLAEPDEMPDTAAITGELNLAGFSNARAGAASAMVQGSLDKIKHLSWRIQGTLKKSGNVKTPDYYLRNTGAEEKNFSYTLDYHRKKWGTGMYYSQYNTTTGIFRGAHIGNLTDLENALSATKPIDSLAAFSYSIGRPYQQVAHELIKTHTHYHFSSKWRAKLQYAWQYNVRQEYDLRRLTTHERESGVVPPDLNLKIGTQTLDALIEHDNIKSFRGAFGANYMRQENIYEGRFFIPNYLSVSRGVFAEEHYILRHVEIEAGLRYDKKQVESFFYENKYWVNKNRYFDNITFNSGLIWKVDSTFNLFANAGSAWRAPAPNELYSNGIHQGLASIEKGDENLNTEKCFNLTLTGNYKKKNLNTELTLYYNYFSNFIYLEPSGITELTIRGAFPVFYYKQTRAKISGLDAKAEYALSRYLSLKARAMIVRSWNYNINDYLIYMPADRGDVSIKLNLPETHVFKKIYFMATGSFVAKQWRVPTANDFAPPPAAYFLLGCDVGTALNIKHQTMLLNFGATNLLNAKYREYLDRFRYYCNASGASYNLKLTIPFTLFNKN